MLYSVMGSQEESVTFCGGQHTFYPKNNAVAPESTMAATFTVR